MSSSCSSAIESLLFGRDSRGNRCAKSSPKLSSALSTGSGVSPPSAHSDPSVSVSQRSRSSAIFSGRSRPAMILSTVSTPRVEPMRHGVHLPQLSCGAEGEGEARLARHSRRCRRIRRFRRGRACPWRRASPRSRAAYRAGCRGNRRPSGPPTCTARIGRPERVPPPKSSTSWRIVAPKASSTRPPRLTLPASWNGCVPRERPTPYSA